MAKYFQRGRFKNGLSTLRMGIIKKNSRSSSSSFIRAARNSNILFIKVLIMRGIGYRVFALRNNLNFNENRPYTTNFLYYLRPTVTACHRRVISENTSEDLFNSIKESDVTPYIKTVDSELEKNQDYYDYANYIFNYDFPYAGYLLARAGHTKDKFLPQTSLNCIVGSKKDRKIVIAASSKT